MSFAMLQSRASVVKIHVLSSMALLARKSQLPKGCVQRTMEIDFHPGFTYQNTRRIH